MGWVRPLFRHRKVQAPADSKLLEVLAFDRFFTAGFAVGVPGDASGCARYGSLTKAW